MKKILLVTIWTSLLLVNASGQDHPYTFNIGGGPGFPVSDVSDFANVGGNFVAGGGGNLLPRFGFDGEFMWHGLPPKNSIVALTGAPSGSARMYSLSGNLLVRTSGENKRGFYAIGGVGWYHRSWELTPHSRRWHSLSPQLRLVGRGLQQRPGLFRRHVAIGEHRRVRLQRRRRSHISNRRLVREVLCGAALPPRVSQGD